MKENVIESTTPHIKVTPYSLEFELGTTWEEARQIGKQLLQKHDQIQFFLGDWIQYCTSISGWGKKYEDVLEKTDYQYHTLRVYVYVANRFPPDKRRYLFNMLNKCSWRRLYEVASCTDEQVEYLLTRADTENWTFARLHGEVQKLHSPVERFKGWFKTHIIVNKKDPGVVREILATPHINDKRIVGASAYVQTSLSKLPALDEKG